MIGKKTAKKFRESIQPDQYTGQSVDIAEVNVGKYTIECQLMVDRDTGRDSCRITVNELDDVCIDSDVSNLIQHVRSIVSLIESY